MLRGLNVLFKTASRGSLSRLCGPLITTTVTAANDSLAVSSIAQKCGHDECVLQISDRKLAALRTVTVQSQIDGGQAVIHTIFILRRKLGRQYVRNEV